MAESVLYNTKPASYSYGNVDALHKWIESMNEKQVGSVLGLNEARKYPLIWLERNWKAEEENSWINFKNITIHVAVNSKVEYLSESRIPRFDICYAVANDFIEALEKRVVLNGLPEYSENANLTSGQDGEAYTSDIWDEVVLELGLRVDNKKECLITK